MKFDTNSIVGLSTGFSFSLVYWKVNHLFLSIYTMSIVDFGLTCVKTAFVGVIGGFCGLLGKEIYEWIKKKINK